MPDSAASMSASTIGESPEVRYSVCLMASTSGSPAACSRKACTEVEKESYGWCSSTSRLAQGREDVGRGRRLDLGQVAVGAGDELLVLQLGPVEGGDAEQAGEVQRAGQRVDLGLGDLQLAHQQVEDLAVDGLLDLQAHRRPEAAPHELLLQGLEEVLGVVLLDLQVLVAGEAEGVVLQHLHAREQLLQVRGDDVLHGDVAAAGRPPGSGTAAAAP